MLNEKSYLEGFSKTAEEAGVDPSVLIKLAGGWGTFFKRVGTALSGAEKARLATQAGKATTKLNKARKAYNAAKKVPGADPTQLAEMKQTTRQLSGKSRAANQALQKETLKVYGARGAAGTLGVGTIFGLGRASKGSPSGTNGEGGYGGYGQVDDALRYASPDYLAQFRTSSALPYLFARREGAAPVFNYRTYVPRWERNMYGMY